MRLIPNALSSKVGVAALKLSKHSPTLLFGAGVVGVVGTVVLAARATLRLEEVIEQTQENLETVKSVDNGEKYTDREILQIKAGVYIHAAGRITKLYGPSVALGVASIGALAGSHHILSKRNAALAAAYKAVETGFRAYRERVVEDLGKEKDLQYLYGLEKQKEVVVDEDGKKKIVDKTVPTNAISPYNVLFHSNNRNWNSTPEYNIIFLRCQQNNLTDKLRSQGFLLLNDMYDALGFDRTKAGCVVGWLADPKYGGDGYVDLGVFDRETLGEFYDYVVGNEDEIWIRPNCDGEIFSKL